MNTLLKHWRFELDQENLAWLSFDQADASVNTLSLETLEELDTALAEIETRHPVGLVLRSGKAAGFIAGADVKKFAGMRDAAEAEALIRRAHAIARHLETLPFPTVAMIHGHCLGGGLELALACKYRVASDDPKTQLGFPEVRLGIFPGFGGTVRSIRYAGNLAAMQLMLTGRSLSARAGKKTGLIDDAVPLRQLEAAAAWFVRTQPRTRRPGWMQRAAGWPFVRPLIARRMTKQAAAHANPLHYPAPFALIDHWRRRAGNEAAMLESEAHEVSRLLTGDAAQNLVRVFLLQERLKAQGDKNAFTPRHLHIIGAGVMGGDIAAWGVLQGLTVSLQDRGAKELARALKRAREFFQFKLKEPRAVTHALDRLIPDVAGAGITSADVVIEAIIEDVEAKRALFEKVIPLMGTDALLATNTSSIPLEVLSKTLPNPEKLVGLHFFNPVAKMPLLEVVRGEQTDPRAVQQALAFARHFNKLPLIVKSSPGFLVNRILMPYLMEAVLLVDEGIPPESIDSAATDFGMPMGPVELADTVGLDICLSVARKMTAQLGGEPPASLVKHVEAGHLGRKSGEGYYHWQNGHPARNPGAAFAQEQQDRLMLRLLNESVACLREGIVDDADLLDAGVVFGAGFAPFRGGPVQAIRSLGAENLHTRLLAMKEKHGERFAPDPGWQTLMNEVKGGES